MPKSEAEALAELGLPPQGNILVAIEKAASWIGSQMYFYDKAALSADEMFLLLREAWANTAGDSKRLPKNFAGRALTVLEAIFRDYRFLHLALDYFLLDGSSEIHGFYSPLISRADRKAMILAAGSSSGDCSALQCGIWRVQAATALDPSIRYSGIALVAFDTGKIEVWDTAKAEKHVKEFLSRPPGRKTTRRKTARWNESKSLTV